MSDLLQYAIDAWLLGTYWYLTTTGKPWPFHLANAVGGLCLIFLTISTVGWIPLLVLTIAFTVLGWYGLWKEAR
jgi:hypothetical protein